MAKSWLDQTHPEYDEIVERDRYTWDHYTGEALDVARNEARKMGAGGSTSIMQQGRDAVDSKLKQLLKKGDPSAKYLMRRSQGEALAAYYERLMISRFPRHFSRIVGTMVGGISIVESKAKRDWGALGDPDKPGTFMYEFWRNVDGQGTNYPTLLNSILTQIIVSHHIWHYVEPNPGLPRVIVLDTANVENWVSADDRFTEVKVRERVDVRQSLREIVEDEKAYADNWLLYDVEGYERFEKMKGKEVSLGFEPWKMPFFTDKARSLPCIPITHTKAPLSIDAGYRVAQSCNALFNMLSDVRNLLRSANHPRLRGKDVTSEQWELIRAEMAEGGNTLLGDFDYINPDPSNASVGYDIYKDEVREVYVEAFQTFEEAARERTATEIATEETRGRRSILSVFSDAVDEVENNILFNVEQTQFPDDPSKWGLATVERSNDFKPLDPEATADRIMREVFPNGIDWPETVIVEMQKKILEGYAIDVDGLDGLLAEAAGLAKTRKAQEDAAIADLTLNGLGV